MAVFQAAHIGSNPIGSIWGHSSDGRAIALQAMGQGFDSPCLHMLG